MSKKCCCLSNCCWSLGESIAANNSYRQREAELSIKRVAVQDISPMWTNASVLESSSGSSRSVHSLTEKIQNGLEVQLSLYCYSSKDVPVITHFHLNCFVFCAQLQEQVKDPHVSEIIDVYEQKLSAFAVSHFVLFDGCCDSFSSYYKTIGKR